MVDLFSQGWGYRKSHTITGSSYGAVSNYQIGLKVYYSSGTDSTENITLTTVGSVYCNSHCKTDFSDLRFTDANDNLLDYWVQTKIDSSYALVWVEADNIPASPSTKTIYVYYGNSSASTASNGANTFPAFTNFDSGIDSGWTWTNQPTSPASYDVSSSNLTISSGGQNVDTWQNTDTSYQLKTTLPTATGFEAICKLSANPTANYHCWGIIAKQNYNNWIEYLDQYYNAVTLSPDSNGSSSTNALIQNGYYSHLALRSLDNYWTGKWTNDPNSWSSSGTSVYQALTSPTIGLIVKTATTTPFSASFDWIFTRALVNPEPSHTSWGTEETPGGGDNQEVTGDLTVDGTLYAKGDLRVDRTNTNPIIVLNKTTGDGDPEIFFRENDSNIMGLGYWHTTPSKFHISDYTTSKTLLTLDHYGVMQTQYNTLDDGSGNMTLGTHGSSIYLFTPTGNPVTITTMDGMGQYPGVLKVLYGLRADDIQANGFLSTTSVNIGGTGGGALFMGHGYGVSNDMPVIELQDTGFTTLWLKAGDGSPQSLPWADMALGNLTANGSISITGYTLVNIANYGYLNSNGNVGSYSYQGNVYVSLRASNNIICGGEIDVVSDQREKNFIDALDAQTALKAIGKLNPLHFVWKTENKKADNVIAGFFAQEVANAIPEAITMYASAKYPDEHTLNYNVLTTYALSAIQGLIKQIEDLKSKVQRLSK